jgi:hypothetical protein
VCGRGQHLAHLIREQVRVVIDQQQVGHASLLPLGVIRLDEVIVGSMAWFVQAAMARGAAAGSTDFRPFRIEDDGAGTPFAMRVRRSKMARPVSGQASHVATGAIRSR